MRLAPLLSVTVLALALTGGSAFADENYFGYAYGSETLPRGHSELYQWATLRSGKADGHYSALDLQTELEHGFTDRLQGSLYLNAIHHHIDQVTGLTDRDRTAWNGIQGSVKYALTSPDKESVGLALYVEPGYTRFDAAGGDRTDKYFFETKLIAQKNLLEGALVWVANLEAEFERENHLEEAEWESELEVQLSTGLSYRIAPRWFVGVEGLATSAFERMHLDALGEDALFVGPNIHYASGRWWFTVTALTQVTGWPETSGHRELDHFEKLQVRTKIGVNF